METRCLKRISFGMFDRQVVAACLVVPDDRLGILPVARVLYTVIPRNQPVPYIRRRDLYYAEGNLRHDTVPAVFHKHHLVLARRNVIQRGALLVPMLGFPDILGVARCIAVIGNIVPQDGHLSTRARIIGVPCRIQTDPVGAGSGRRNENVFSDKITRLIQCQAGQLLRRDLHRDGNHDSRKNQQDCQTER